MNEPWYVDCMWMSVGDGWHPSSLANSNSHDETALGEGHLRRGSVRCTFRPCAQESRQGDPGKRMCGIILEPREGELWEPARVGSSHVNWRGKESVCRGPHHLAGVPGTASEGIF